jgi:branched-chain amino acid transport system permease protein
MESFVNFLVCLWTGLRSIGQEPDLLLQVLWEGLVSGVLYALIALGFVLIFRSSRIFNFAQGIMVVFAALTLVGLHSLGIPAWIAVALTLGVMFVLAVSIERVVLRPLVGQPDIILFMATIGITLFLIGFGETIFGGENKVMIKEELGIPTGEFFFVDGQVEITIPSLFAGGESGTTVLLNSGLPEGWFMIFQHLDLTVVVVAALLVGSLLVFLNYTQMGRAIRALGDDHQAALSVGISLQTIWVLVWFIAGIIALVTGIAWGARAGVSFALEVIAYKALPVLMLGGLESITGAIVGGLMIGILEKIFEIYLGQPCMGGNTETWFAFVLALIVLLFRPQGLFGERIIERV